jgi:hypothetical protein
MGARIVSAVFHYDPLTFKTCTLSPLYTLIFPLRVPPYTDGHSWARRDGYDWHRGVHQGEELSEDDEEDSV